MAIGELLKRSRESQGLSLEHLASLTRIQQPFLKALEEENFGHLPEQVFTKGFVRTYAQALGLDEEEAIRQFSESSHLFYKTHEETQRQTRQQIENTHKGTLNRNVVLIVTGAVLIGLLFFIFPYKQIPPQHQVPVQEKTHDKGTSLLDTPSSQQKETHTPTPTETSSPIVPTSPTSNSIGSKQEEAPVHVASKPVTQAPLPLPQDIPDTTTVEKQPLVLELKATQITWVVVQSDDGIPNEALLQPGETAQWKATKRFVLTLGNAGGVQVWFNGEPRELFGKPGMVIRNLEITP
ncbi:MAG: DUF4115 domain-containing protein [Nitrospirales bacterium]|nr:DUF4115 domain-containing protein [Nitrospirales bacterium]